MKTRKYFISILIIICFIHSVKSQSDDCSDSDIILNRKSINDSLTIPIFNKGYLVLSNIIIKYFCYSDSFQCDDNEFYIIDFGFGVDDYGRLVGEKLHFNNNVSKDLILIFPQLIKDIDKWRPSYQIETNNPIENYFILTRIEIYKYKVLIKFLNGDSQSLYEREYSRPLCLEQNFSD